jgi:hypothetical protein
MNVVPGAKNSLEPLSNLQGPRLSTRHAYLVVSIVLAWSVIQFYFARPESIVDDWNGWRQAETQTSARNFLRPHSNIFFPQINWGGDGPGYVETEFQLYTYFVSLLLPFSNNQDLPGQVLNIFFVSISALLIYYSLRQRYSFPSALCGCAVWNTLRESGFLWTASLILDRLGFRVFRLWPEKSIALVSCHTCNIG